MAINAANYDVAAGAIHPTNSNRYLAVMIADSSGNVSDGIGGGTAIDAFGRLRTSEPFTLFDSSHVNTQNDKWSFALVGAGATYSYSQSESVVKIGIGTTSGTLAYTETKRVFAYQPGKSFLVLNSFAMNTPKTNLRQRVGLFSTDAGVYLENDGSDNYLVLRSSVAGVTTETRVIQSSWNGDKLNGSGSSALNLSVDKANLLWMDIEWLGVGDVRVGFVHNHKLVTAHTFRNINQNTTTYMRTSCLPLRQEIEAVGNVSGISTFKQICSTVVSEGGYTPFSERYSAGIGASTVTLTNPGQAYKYITSIRLSPGYENSVIKIAGITGATSDNTKTAHIRILKNATLTGNSWTNQTTRVQYNNTATYSGGTVVGDAFLAGGGAVAFGDGETFELFLGRNLAGVSTYTSEIYTLVGQGLQNNVDFGGNIQWFELA